MVAIICCSLAVSMSELINSCNKMDELEKGRVIATIFEPLHMMNDVSGSGGYENVLKSNTGECVYLDGKLLSSSGIVGSVCPSHISGFKSTNKAYRRVIFTREGSAIAQIN